jgi:oxygen-independent coproporphyrinogen-3 oxidase
MILLHRDWDFAAADRGSARALESDPNDARNHLVAAAVKAAAGRPEEAIAAARRAIELDPASLRVKADLRAFLLSAGRYAEAAAESRELLALEPNLTEALDSLKTARERLGRYGEGPQRRHNGKYRDDAPFLGFGMAAHSCRDGRRCWNHDRYATYCRAVEAGGGRAARAGGLRPSPRERAAEALFTGLRRREGIALAALRGRYGIDPLVEWKDGLETVPRAGLVVVDEDRLRLTDRGMLLSNEVLALFI